MTVTKQHALIEMEKLLAGEGGAYDWDDFTTLSIDDLQLDALRIVCAELPRLYPPSAGQYCNDEGLARLRQIACELRQEVKNGD